MAKKTDTESNKRFDFRFYGCCFIVIYVFLLLFAIILFRNNAGFDETETPFEEGWTYEEFFEASEKMPEEVSFLEGVLYNDLLKLIGVEKLDEILKPLQSSYTQSGKASGEPIGATKGQTSEGEDKKEEQ